MRALSWPRCEVKVDVVDETRLCGRRPTFRVGGRHLMCADHAMFLKEMAGARLAPLPAPRLVEAAGWVVDVAGLCSFVVSYWWEVSHADRSPRAA